MVVAGTSHLSCCHSQRPTALGSLSAAVTHPRHLRSSEWRCNLATFSAAKGRSYHVEVEVEEDEDPEGMYKKFRNSCNLSGVTYEARRRQYFENPQDIKKRKQQEKGLRKMRDMRERYLETYDDAHSDTPPFSDLFIGEDDLYGVMGEDSDLDDDDVRPNNQPGQAVYGDYDHIKSLDALDARGKSGQNGRGFSNGQSPQSYFRSIPALGPAAAEGADAGDRKTKDNGKPKVETARDRRAAKKMAVQGQSKRK